MEVKRSLIPGAGLGLFACKHFPKNTLVGYYGGKILPAESVTASDYIIDNHSTTNFNNYLDASQSTGGICRYINDHNNHKQPRPRPNDAASTPRFYYNARFASYKERKAKVMTLKGVDVGEEFYINYGAAYWSFK